VRVFFILASFFCLVQCLYRSRSAALCMGRKYRFDSSFSENFFCWYSDCQCVLALTLDYIHVCKNLFSFFVSCVCTGIYIEILFSMMMKI